MQNQCNCMSGDDVELIKFADDFNKAYPCGNENGE